MNIWTIITGLCRVPAQLENLQLSVNEIKEAITIMNKSEAARLDKLTNDIKARFEALIAKLGDQLTAEEQAAVDADFATLEALGADGNDPVPA